MLFISQNCLVHNFVNPFSLNVSESVAMEPKHSGFASVYFNILSVW